MRASSIKRSLGVDLTNSIKESRVLLVGAGGIGCELLKNLVLTGFGEIHIVDLDTIDLSNLNRQFLFRHEHIKKPKALVRLQNPPAELHRLLPCPPTVALFAPSPLKTRNEVAKEVAHRFQPSVRLEAHHADITESRFNVDWFKSFNIVFNALDNLAARRHVNRMCLAASVPLVESGTTGFNGQVQVIEKVSHPDAQRAGLSDNGKLIQRFQGTTECYDCNEKETPKSFPICTIRSNPSQPIHCIVWAKSYLIPELFGKGEESDILDNTETAENAEEIAELRKEAEALKEIRESMGSDEFSRKVFEKVFKTDIERLREAEDMWKERKAPDILDYDTLSEASKALEPLVSIQDQREWTIEEDFVVFKDSLKRLSARLKELKDKKSPEDPEPVLTFDKDDVDTLDFVTATANLRATAFHLNPKSKFDTKQMAGNIIPAIATTNAMTAGLCVLQAFKVLQNDLANAKMVFLERSGARAINSDSLDPPKPDCPVCSPVFARITVDLQRATLQDVVEGVLRSELGYGEELSIIRGTHLIFDPDMEDELPKKLSDLNIGHETFLTIIDDDDVGKAPRVNLELVVMEQTEPSSEESAVVSLQQVLDIPRKSKKPEATSSEETTAANGTAVTGKRKREGEDEPLTNGHISKKVVGESSINGKGDDTEPIVLDDDGTILIDD
ncbi:ubiquitin-like activating enzyme [Penicillium macrosclerotiorum]|uniref:ubiquitin-like activating enzyme n=1 Tax=Penicillium macrosclerotiorum TaxID=303699 RepID=UPI002547A873|nr:ubiquitin-like activating enzyme [Penicillium macrosclerotiorum]KAJ5690752.1 ubiquitin-like activating enzyme [Penicillium macrosclerotiorum]